MQQAVLGCSQLEKTAFQLLPAASPAVAPRILTEHDKGQVLKASTSSQAEGRKEEKWKAGCPSRIPPPQAPLPHRALAHREQGRIYHNANHDRRSICQQAWPEMRGPGTHALPWLFKNTQSRSHFLEQWILHGGAATSHLLCSCSVKHLTCCISSLPLHSASTAE